MDDSVLEGMRTYLSCNVCFELLVEPKTLHCFHTFCQACIMKHIETKTSSNEKVSCPLCDEVITKEEVEKTKVNFNYVSMIEQLNQKDKMLCCSVCGEDTEDSTARGYCKECTKYLCDYCIKGHRRSRALSSHEIKLLQTEEKPMVVSTERKCSVHPGERLSMFCVSHEKVICTACAFLEHRTDCSVSYIDAKTIQAECKSICDQLPSLKERYEEIKQEKQVLEEAKKETNSIYERIKQQIQGRKEAVMSQVTGEEAELTREATEWYRATMKEYTLLYDNVESRVNQVSSIITGCEALEQNEPTFDSLMSKIQLSRQIESDEISKKEDIPSLDDKKIEFRQKGLLGALVKEKLQKVSLSVTTPIPTQREEVEVEIDAGSGEGGAQCTASVNNEPVAITASKGKYSLKWTPQTHGSQRVEVEFPEHQIASFLSVSIRRSYAPLVPEARDFPLPTPPLGVCFISDNTLAVTSNGRKIKLLNTESSAEDDIQEIDGDFVRPYFMAADKNREHLWVTDREGHNVKRISLANYAVDLQYGTRGAGYGQLSHPRGVAVSSDNSKVYIADMRNNRVVVIQIQNDGSVREVGTIGEAELNQPAGLAFTRSGNLVVCDDRNCRLVLFAPDGRQLQTMGVARSGQGLLCSPIGVAVDEYGRYVVGEFGSHCVTTISQEGDILSCTRTAGGVVKEFTYPRGVTIDNKGFIFVADHGNKRIVQI